MPSHSRVAGESVPLVEFRQGGVIFPGAQSTIFQGFDDALVMLSDTDEQFHGLVLARTPSGGVVTITGLADGLDSGDSVGVTAFKVPAGQDDVPANREIIGLEAVLTPAAPELLLLATGFAAGDRVGIRARPIQGTLTGATLTLHPVNLGNFLIGGIRRVIVPNGVSVSGFTCYAKLVEQAPDIDLVARSQVFAELSGVGETAEISLLAAAYQGQFQVEFEVGLSGVITVAVDTRDGADAWVEVDRVTFNSGGASGIRAFALSITDTGLVVGDGFRLRVVSANAQGLFAVRDGLLSYDELADGADTIYSVTPNTADMLNWWAIFGGAV